MTHCCSQCNFTSHFESALLMHHQLHHEGSTSKFVEKCDDEVKSNTHSRCMSSESTMSFKFDKGFKACRTSSATRLFDKLRARIRRSRTMITQPDQLPSPEFHQFGDTDTSLDIVSECTSKALQGEASVTSASASMQIPAVKDLPETYSCHLCNFDADRITVLDRHLLNDHKIGLENLLQLVMAKTKDGLSEIPVNRVCSVREPYYKNIVQAMSDDEFVIETVGPKIKIMKHAATNTDLKWNDIPDLTDNCQMITNELEKLMKNSPEKCDQEHFMEKMQTLNEYMCKFMDTSNTLKRTLTKEFGSRNSIRDRLSFDLTLGERDSPLDWERTHSEKSERNRMRNDKKLLAESLYF